MSQTVREIQQGGTPRNGRSVSRIYPHCSKVRKTVQEGRIVLKDDQRESRPIVPTNLENVGHIARLVEEDRRISIQKLAGIVGIPFGSTYSILHDHLGLKKVSRAFFCWRIHMCQNWQGILDVIVTFSTLITHPIYCTWPQVTTICSKL